MKLHDVWLGLPVQALCLLEAWCPSCLGLPIYLEGNYPNIIKTHLIQSSLSPIPSQKISTSPPQVISLTSSLKTLIPQSSFCLNLSSAAEPHFMFLTTYTNTPPFSSVNIISASNQETDLHLFFTYDKGHQKHLAVKKTG